MTFYAFRLLSPAGQLYWVLQHGTYLAQRWDEDGGVNLYHCADERWRPAVATRSLVSSSLPIISSYHIADKGSKPL